MASHPRQTAAACLLVLLHAAATSADLTIDSSTDLRIDRSGPAQKELQLASDVLARYLTAVLGRQELAGEGEPVRFVVEADAVIWHQLPEDTRSSLGDIDAFTVSIDDAARTVTIHGATVLAACFGVYDFLERDLGVMWLFPGELGTAIPDQRSYALAAGSRRVAPDVTSRLYTGLRYSDQGANLDFRRTYGRDHPLFDQRHFFEGYDYHQSLRLHFLASPSHNMINIFPPAWALEHPQVLPVLEDGTRFQPALTAAEGRDKYQAWHPCYSDELTVRHTIDAARAAFGRGEMCFSLGINDGHRVQCQCDRCRDAGWPMSYYGYVATVAEALKDTYPPHVLGVLVYGDVREPDRGMRLPENVLCMVSGNSTLSRWSGHAHHLGQYAYFFGNGFFVPSFPLASMKHNAALFAEYGVRSFRAEVDPVWAFDAPKVYLQSRLLWNLSDDTDAALSRWCNAAFGGGGDATKRFYLRWADKWAYLAEHRGKDPAPYCAMDRWRNTTAQFAACTPEDFRYSAECIDQARLHVKPGKEADRLTMVETYFERASKQFDTYHAVQGLFSDAARDSDLHGLFDRLIANQRRIAELDSEIEANAQWHLGTSDDADEHRAYSSIDNEMHSGLITGALSIPETGRANVSPMLRPYVSGRLTAQPVSRIKLVEGGGWYWGLESTQHMYEPMTVTADGAALRAQTAGRNPVIEQGARAGQFEQHWAFSLIPTAAAGPNQRRLIRFDIEAAGLDGDLSVQINNMWRREDGDHLPVTVAIALDGSGTTHKRTVIVEPTDPGSDRHGEPTHIRFGMLFTPAHEGSRCEVRATVQEIRIDHGGESP